MRGICIGLLLAICLPCVAADDFKIIKLEQDVLMLERRVEELSRQVAQLQQSGVRATAQRAAPVERPVAPAGSPLWLSAANWSRVRTGMSEFEVIDILGPPSSLRGAPDADSRTLMYAMEIGSSGFLSGSVRLKERRVVEVQIPVLQ
jgi:hypothetical protein